MWIRYVCLGFISLAAGVTVSGGFLAVITMLGVVPRLAGETKTMKNYMLYENFLILGAIFGNVFSLYEFPLRLGPGFLAVFGIFAGIYIGSLAVALAEIINTFPIFTRRIRLRKGMPYLVFALAFGKGIGSLIQYFIFQ